MMQPAARRSFTVSSLLAVAAALAPGAVALGDTLVGLGSTSPDRQRPVVEAVNEKLGLRKSSVFVLPIDPTPGRPVFAFVPTDVAPMLLDLQPHSVRSDDYQLLVPGPDGALVPVEPGPERTLRGEALAFPGSVVAASMLEDGLHARVMLADGRDFWIEPLAGRVRGAGAFDYVMYDNEDVLETGATCALDAAAPAGELLGDAGSTDGADSTGGVAGTGGSCIAQIACDADYEFFQARGSVGSVEAWISSVINTVNIQYQRDVGITHTISGIVVRSTRQDPYNNSKNASSLLSQFRGEWESNPSGLTYDLAQLFTGRELSGSTIGIAWLGSVCTSYRYSLVQSLFAGNDPSPDACATDLSAHEMGHNWGADHCSCTANTMNSYITCANVFHPTFTVPDIIAHRDSRPCLDNCGGGSSPTGACCTTSGCVVTTEADCNGAGGTYQGDGTGCSPDPCAGDPTGACCVGTACSIETAADCAAGGGTYLGDGTGCSGGPCGGGTGGAIVECIVYETRGGPQQNKHLDVTVAVVDGSGNPVGGANVSMTLSRSAGGSWSFGGSTDGAGEVTFTLLGAADGCYTSDVTSITGAGSFDGSEPANGFLKGSDAFPDADCRASSDPCGG
ncbi:MAG: M12 family metallo-peptidase [Planctomycetota bacterium]|jgi:hypothetical protein